MVTERDLVVSDVLPHAVWESLKSEPNTALVDVRTQAEWAFVGLPDLTNLEKDVILLEWLTYPGMSVNQNFADELFQKFGDRIPDSIFFICRSGARSLSAANLVAEFARDSGHVTRCFNVAEGFEGDLDADRHRASLNGWKKRGLPWRQT